MNKIAILGCASVDSIIYMSDFPDPIPQTLIADRFYETVGSTGSGKALNMAKLGFEVDFHALIGDDHYGHKIINFMKSRIGLNFLYNIDIKATQRHCNIMNEHGQRISIFMHESSYNLVGDTAEIEKIIKESDCVILNIAAYCKDYIPLIKKYKKEIWCDLHDYNGANPYHNEFIECADYVFMSSDNSLDYRKFMESQISAGKKLVVCTHGRSGACILTANREYFAIPIINEYERIDTNGAGDSFMSGFMYGYLKGFDMLKCMQFATITAGLCINSPELVNEKLSPELLLSEHPKYYD